MKHLVICGSPRANGRSAAIAQGVARMVAAGMSGDAESAEGSATMAGAPGAFEAGGFAADGSAAGAPGVSVDMLYVSDLRIQGCIGCDYCRSQGTCLYRDGMVRVMEALQWADELHLVSPVYFAGPPSQLKALLDRLQPHYWQGTRALPKRPAHLHVVGEGGDPHGYGPLVTICKSALAVAGFALETVTPHIAAADVDFHAVQPREKESADD